MIMKHSVYRKQRNRQKNEKDNERNEKKEEKYDTIEAETTNINEMASITDIRDQELAINIMATPEEYNI